MQFPTAGQHLPREIFAPPRLAAPESSRMEGERQLVQNIGTVLRSGAVIFLAKVSKSFYRNVQILRYKCYSCGSQVSLKHSLTIKRAPSGCRITKEHIVSPTPPPLNNFDSPTKVHVQKPVTIKGGKTLVTSS